MTFRCSSRELIWTILSVAVARILRVSVNDELQTGDNSRCARIRALEADPIHSARLSQA